MQNPLGAFSNTFDLQCAIIGLENQFVVCFESGRLTQVLLYRVSIAENDLHSCQAVIDHELLIDHPQEEFCTL